MILREMIDTVFSHNSLVALWETDKENNHWSDKAWGGMAHEIPERFLNREATIFGVYGYENGYINIHLGDRYIKPTVDKLITYTREVSYLYNDCQKKNEHISNRYHFGMLEAIRYISHTILRLPFVIKHNENGYICSVSIGSRTVELENEENR